MTLFHFFSGLSVAFLSVALYTFFYSRNHFSRRIENLDSIFMCLAFYSLFLSALFL